MTDISCDKNQIIKFEKIETYVGQLTEGFESHINRIFNQICHDLGDPVQICSQNIFSQVSIPRLNIEKLSVAVATKIVKFSVLLNNLVTHYLAKKIFIITANIFNIWAETIHSELRLTPHNSTTRILKIYNHID